MFTDNSFGAFVEESLLIVIETTSARDYWKDVLQRVNFPTDQIVCLPGFRGDLHRRSWFQTGQNFRKCELGKVFWVPNNKLYPGHSEVLFRWLLQKGLVLVDNTASCGCNLMCSAPLLEDALPALKHSRTIVADKTIRVLKDLLDTAPVTRYDSARMHLFPAVGGEFLHIHVQDDRTLNCVREYYRDQGRFLSLKLEAITSDEPFLYDRLVDEVTAANILFFEVAGSASASASASTSAFTPEIQVDSVFHWLDRSRAIVVCSSGNNWPTFDRELVDAESAYVNYVQIPPLSYDTVDSELDHQQPQLFPKLVLDRILSGSETRLYDTYIQYG